VRELLIYIYIYNIIAYLRGGPGGRVVEDGVRELLLHQLGVEEALDARLDEASLEHLRYRMRSDFGRSSTPLQ